MHTSLVRRTVLAAALTAALFAPAFVAAQQQDALSARVDSLFARWDRPDSPGCALGVYRNGAIILARGYGMADLERRVPITPHSVFDIGSTSKQFSAASILLLAQDGKLSLDDDVRKHIPELPVYSRPITIRHLLHHTSGLRDYIGLMILAGSRIDDVTTADDALAMIARQKELNFEPGEEHLYSNSGYFLLSLIVERSSGKSLREFARERIFQPLGMTRTHYLGSYDDIVPDRAMAYSPRPGGGLRTDMSRWLQLGDGAVFTTVEELLLWDENFYHARIGGPQMLAELLTPGKLSNGNALSYALGLSVDEYRGQRVVSHGGGWGGYRAELMRFPEQHFSVATVCNLGTINPSVLARGVAEIYLADVLAPAPAHGSASAGQSQTSAEPAVRVPESALRELAGTYRSGNRVIRTLVLDGGSLFLIAGATRFELRPQSPTEFTLVGAPEPVSLTFTPHGSGGPRQLLWRVAEREPVTFEKLQLVQPTSAQLAEYAGSFFSEELQASVTVTVSEGRLSLRGRAESMTLSPLTRDEFSAGGVTLRFMRDSGGAVTGFLLDQGRARNLRFERGEGR